MKWVGMMLAAAMLLSAAPAWALSADEVLRLKKAGVSDETIQLMLQQERTPKTSKSPVTETKSEVVYQAGEDMGTRLEESRRRERDKERRAMEGVGNVIIDGRAPLQRPRPRTGQ